MVRVGYNIAQWLAIILFGPLLFVKVIITPKYRKRFRHRLGIGIAALFQNRRLPAPRIWVHALSVGEVSSVVPLVRAIRSTYPDGSIIFTATTSSGEHIARQSLADIVDVIGPFPLDLAVSVRRFIAACRPDLFILVETDFWPNLLYCLKEADVPAMLVNGRISRLSFDHYRRFAWLFRPLFDSFTILAMQTEEDRQNMIRIGLQPNKVQTLGNLKYDLAPHGATTARPQAARHDYHIPEDSPVWIAGSTHAGEEEMVFRVYRRLLADHPHLFLVIAPRNVERGEEIAGLARRLGLSVFKRTEVFVEGAKVLVLNTLGELSGLYRLADLVFLGGSLVAAGGHNPLEPACFAKPVLFGPHMEDFAEISRDLCMAGGGSEVIDEESLYRQVNHLLESGQARKDMGQKAHALIKTQQGVTARHVERIKTLLSRHAGDQENA